MTFVRIKRSHGRDYAYVVESYRDAGGQVHQRVVRYLGPTEPIYGGRGPVDLHEARQDLKRKKKERAEI